MSPRPSRPEYADISFAAEVGARKLRFHDAPDTPAAARDMSQPPGSDRRNLPKRVRPAVTYRDVQVDYRLAAKLSWEPG